jgi:acetolactate synthase I/II/III large subunit
MKKNNIIYFNNDVFNSRKYNNFSKNEKKLSKDKTNYSEVIVRKPWGYEYLIYQNKYVSVWILHILKKQETSMHCHPQKKTSLIVLNGRVICKNLQNIYSRKTGESVIINKEVFHSTSNNSNKNAVIMEIESPNNKHDLLRLKDKYGREKKGYEKKSDFSVNTNNYNYITLKSEKTYHNLTKKFSSSSITFINIKNIIDLNKLIKKNLGTKSLITILSGKIKLNNKVYHPADTIDLSYVSLNLNNLMFFDNLILLLSKQNDKIIKASDLIFNVLENENINKAFVTPGDSNLHLLDSLGKRENFKYMVFQNEYFSSFASLGYSKFMNTPPILLISSGTSSLKVVEAVSNAYIDSEPLIVISGQVTREHIEGKKLRQLGSKSINLSKVVKNITKYFAIVKNIKDLNYHLEKGIYLSKKGRSGPVWIDLPIDILGKTVNENQIKYFDSSEFDEISNYKNTNNKIEKIHQYLYGSKRPLLLIGYGVRLSNSEKQILDLVKKLKIPVMTSRRGVDLINSANKYYFGRPGVYGNRYSNIILQKADLLISIGSRLSVPLIGRKKYDFAKNAKKIIIDIDKNELIKKTIKPDLSINASSDIVINFLLKNNLRIKNYENWIKICKKIRKEISFKEENYSDNTGINPYNFIKYLSKITPSKSIIFMDGGPVMNYVMQGFEVKLNQRIITNSGLDSEGFALPASLGIDQIYPFQNVIVICDELSIFSILENIEKIEKTNFNFKVFIMHGAKNIALQNSQKDFFGSRYVATKLIDNKKDIFKNMTINNTHLKIKQIVFSKKYKKQIFNTFKNNKTEIFYVKLDPEHKLKPKLGFSIDFDGNWYPKPLEDMYPFLNNKKLEKIMKI